MRRRGIRAARALTAALLALSLAVQPAFAYSKSGDTTCSSLKRVWIYSTAEVEVYHWYRFYYRHWTNPGFVYRENNTGYSSTWWVIEYDVAIIQPWGTECRSI